MNMRNLTAEQINNQIIDEVFDYYDKPILYSCVIDSVRYLIYWVNDSELQQNWLYLPMSNSRYQETVKNNIPLYLLFREPEGVIYEVVVTKEGRNFVNEISPGDIHDGILPEPMCYLTANKRQRPSK